MPCGFLFSKESINTFYESKNINPNSFHLNKVTEEEVFKQLSQLNVNKATGHDGLAARFLKDGAPEICSPLTYIINLSFETSTVISDTKVPKVVPLFKKGDKANEGNYRPVSILPIVSKIYERLAYNQLYKYLQDNNLIYEYQSGFRNGYSTDSAIINLTDTIRHNTDKGYMTGLILLDLQKAFDTVNHEILCHKLTAIGLGKNSVDWFKSYLSNRSQFVELDGIRSSEQSITCGVPQGSILGPLLFLLHVKNMISVIDGSCKLYLYADDSILSVVGKKVDEIEMALSRNMESVRIWLLRNKLSLHLGKTFIIL